MESNNNRKQCGMFDGEIVRTKNYLEFVYDVNVMNLIESAEKVFQTFAPKTTAEQQTMLAMQTALCALLKLPPAMSRIIYATHWAFSDFYDALDEERQTIIDAMSESEKHDFMENNMHEIADVLSHSYPEWDIQLASSGVAASLTNNDQSQPNEEQDDETTQN